MKKKVSKIIWGGCLITIGLIYILNSFKIINLNIFFNGWWTLFIIIPSFVGIIFNKAKAINIFFLILGISLLFYNLSIIQFQNVFDIVLCLIFILIGVKLVSGDSKTTNNPNYKPKEVPTYFSIFSRSKELLDDNKEYRIICIFGHSVIDLTKLKANQKYYINTYTIFCNCDFIINKDKIVVPNVFNILGFFQNKPGKIKKSKKNIFLTGLTLLGKINIKTKTK